VDHPFPVLIPDDILARLRSARRAMALTGAGVSAESGIPTFRNPGTGLWSQYSPEVFATQRGWNRDPRLVWAWYTHRRRIARAAEPNPAHRALARLANHYPEFAVVTQNVDGLHHRGGSPIVHELHGSLHRFKCSVEGTPVAYADHDDGNPAALEALERGETPEVPHCPACGALVRPDVVWFGEPLPPKPYLFAEVAALSCEVCFVVGTSALVYPAAGLPEIARRRGALIVEVNPEETELTPDADLSLRGPAGVMLPRLVERIIAGAEPQAEER
jgi:NAD-dependent deacetylase